MSIVRNVLNWTDKKLEEIDVSNDKHPLLKSFGLGCIEGIIDIAAFACPVLLVASIVKNKGLNK